MISLDQLQVQVYVGSHRNKTINTVRDVTGCYTIVQENGATLFKLVSKARNFAEV